MRHIISRAMKPAAVLAVFGLAGCVGVPAPGPVVYAPGAPPPAYVAPGYAPPGYAPPAPQAVAYGATCFAGVYTCQLPEQLPVGTQCSCPGIGAPSFGNVR